MRRLWCPEIPNNNPLFADDVQAAIDQVKGSGMKVGLALKPDTHVDTVLPFLPSLDMVLVMTVEPGFGGQSFMQGMMAKVCPPPPPSDRHEITPTFLLCRLKPSVLLHLICISKWMAVSEKAPLTLLLLQGPMSLWLAQQCSNQSHQLAPSRPYVTL
jgi:hypothetical protein